MLLSLHVKNFAIIDEVYVDFGAGMNILTGETGAGKSILLGSVNAALGGKVSKEMLGLVVIDETGDIIWGNSWNGSGGADL